MRLGPCLVIAASVLLVGAIGLVWGEPVIARHCQILHSASDEVASCQIELSERFRTLRRSLRPWDQQKLRFREHRHQRRHTMLA